MSKFCLETSVIALIFLTALYPHNAFPQATADATSTSDFPKIQLAQTADIKVVFLGISSDYVDESMFLSRVTRNVKQFAQPNNMTWNLNMSIALHEFPPDVMTSLTENAYSFEGVAYYNITLLETLLLQFDYLAVPNKGYLFVFMSIPDGGVDHSWFFVEERPDLFLGRTDFLDSQSSKYWAFPPSFGGAHRALYFDMSELIEKNPGKAAVTNNAIGLFNNALSDVFVNLLGATDSRMIIADTQRYENYEVKILWLNGTDDEFPTQRIERAFEDLMPWTNWTVTTQIKDMDAGLNSLVESRTTELTKPLNYSFSLANGSTYLIQAERNVQWDVFQDSGEHDPITQYLFEHVKDYFNLTDLEDRSIIPVVLLQTQNDTAIGGVAGIGPAISWFSRNIIIMGYQGGTLERMGESGPTFLTQQLRHEIGHWVSLSHHSARFDLGYPKVICSMRSLTNRFCAFCKDARARMSFISYYKATTELISNNQAQTGLFENELETAARLFNEREYANAIETIISVYNDVQPPPSSAIDFRPILLIITTAAVVVGVALVLRKRLKLSTLKALSRRGSQVKILPAAPFYVLSALHKVKECSKSRVLCKCPLASLGF